MQQKTGVRPDLTPELMTSSTRLHEILEHIARIRAIVEDDPAMAGVFGDALEWGRRRGLVDYLGTGSPLERIKTVQRDIYLEHVGDVFAGLPAGARVLDAGCGCGRFAEVLAGYPVDLTVLDAMPAAVEAAQQAAEKVRHVEASVTPLVADVRSLDDVPSDHFDAVLAMELVCYMGSPADAVRELARVTRPGGSFVVSVEARYGTALHDQRLDLDGAIALLRSDHRHYPYDVDVRYSTRESLVELLEECGLAVDRVVGCHYVADGPFDRLVDWTRDDPEHRERLLELERLCGADRVLSEIPRVWMAVARRR